MTQRLVSWHQVKTLCKEILRSASSAISLIPLRQIEDIWSLLYWVYCDYIVYNTLFILLQLTWCKSLSHSTLFNSNDTINAYFMIDCDAFRKAFIDFFFAQFHKILLLPLH